HMNTFPLSFVVHAGDFKDNVSPCTDSRFNQVKDSFNKSTAPFVYTPGDNDWMDCDKNAGNPMDRVERLNKLREVFFPSVFHPGGVGPDGQSLGQNRMLLTTQRQEGFPENTRWTKQGVVFATINAPGANDNIDYCTTPSPTCTYEAGPRRVANKAWLRQTFESAEATNAPAVMIIWQADPWQPGPQGTHNRRNWDYLMGCDDPAIADCQEPGLRQLSKAFGKPVVLVHGDTHIPRIDQGGWPTKKDGGATIEMVGAFTDVPNFTRVETYAGGLPTSGSQIPPEPKKWLRVTVDPKDPKVFSFTPETAP
ncbi:MAG TPA: hypothetical protein VG795_13255, partial [Acidimicrobiia bacterium]|nr:hypothetical protein [Acidimicrobiia bacterium]